MIDALYHVYDSAVLDAPIEEVWQEVRDVTKLIPVVFGDNVKEYGYVEGGSAEKVPSRFAFTLVSGESSLEEVVARSETEHAVTYRIHGQIFGIERYTGTYRLRRVTTEPGKTFLEFPREFGVAAGHDPAQVVPAIAALAAKEVAAIKAHFAKRRRAA